MSDCLPEDRESCGIEREAMREELQSALGRAEAAESSLSKALAQVAELEAELNRVGSDAMDIGESQGAADMRERAAKLCDDKALCHRGTTSLFGDEAALQLAKAIRAALHREPGDAKPVSAADMRERIAIYLEAEADKLTAEFVDHATAKCRAESYRIAARNIRALPLTAPQGSDDG